jgi:hypothetical protein
MGEALTRLQADLLTLEAKKDLTSAKQVVKSVVSLLIPEVSNQEESNFKLFRDSDGKLDANSSWFFTDNRNIDRLATYTFEVPETVNLDIKIYGVKKTNMRIISWVIGLTPNFEDEPFNGAFNVGIDFVIPESMDKVIVALSKNYVVRTIELKGKLTATFMEILSQWEQLNDFSKKSELHNILWNSLDLQPLNRKFYEGISQRFQILRQHLDSHKILENSQSVHFANRLIGRLIFTWFLNKKDLLNSDVGYFNSIEFNDDSEYYRQRLEPLFFDVLNTPIAERKTPDLISPYLNGGLFDPKITDLVKDTKLSFPKNYFDDLYEFLNGYNFTTDESTSEFQQVAIDPEMLGRIFENLLAEISDETGDQARKAKGAFYTPREIVDFMCREALKRYLKSAMPEDENLDSRIYQIIDAPEREFQDQDHNWRRDLKPYKVSIMKALDELKILDPACGSGAFPIGMMQLLVKVLSRLEPRFDNHKAKLSIIEKNIFGIDIDSMAIEISRLRAWLALLVDEEVNIKTIKPLPNLDFKFVNANTLIQLESQSQQTFFEDYELDNKLQDIRDQYFSTDSPQKKRKLKTKYSELVQEELTIFGESKRTQQLKTFRPFDSDQAAIFFDSQTMFGVDKFQIIIGNPPYVRQEKIKYKKDLEEYKVFQSTSDLYTYFFEFALDQVTPFGVISFITSSKFGRALYGAKLRNLLSTETLIDFIVDFGKSHVFSAITNTWIVQTQKCEPIKNHQMWVKTDTKDKGIPIKQNELVDKQWAFLDSENGALIAKIDQVGPSIENADYKIFYGIKTGCNEAFLLDEAEKDLLLTQDPKNIEIIKPLLRGRDIGKYEIQPVSVWILATKNGLDIENDYPDVAKLLKKRNKELANRPELRGDKGSHWMNLRDCAYYKDMEAEKLVWLELSDKNKFAFSDKGEYILAGAFMISGKHLKVLLGILNSSLIHYYFKFISNSSGMGTTQWKKFAVEKLPIPNLNNIDPAIYKEIEKLVDERSSFSSKSEKNQALRIEDRINDLVHQLYGLNANDIAIIKDL